MIERERRGSSHFVKAGTRRLEGKRSNQNNNYYDNDDDGTEREGDASMKKTVNYGSDSEDDMQFGRIASGKRQRLVSEDASEDPAGSHDSRRITTFLNNKAFGDEDDSYDPRRETTNIIK